MPRARAIDSTEFDKLSIYIPVNKQIRQPLERLQKLARKQDRSLNHMVVQAILEYVEREERAEAREKYKS